MTKLKTYSALVVWEQGANVYINANNATEAGEMVRKLLKAERAQIELDQTMNSEYKVEDMREVEAPETSERKYAEENADEFSELEAE